MSIRFKSFSISLFAVLIGVSGCATPDVIVQEPVLPVARVTQNALFELPPPLRKLDVAVYKFEDVTGQFKPADGFQDLSRAVSQGGASILVKALHDAGRRSWFTVIERSSLNNLLQERKIITEMRQRYTGNSKPDPKFLPPMRFAGILMEGGIVGYDSNTLTGGAGARLLGIGANAEYRQDTISVNLRAVSVKTGEIMASTVVHKTLISAGVSGGSFSFIDVDKLLEIEAGVSTNEPGLVALTKAIEKAVHSLILEGADLNLWAFEDQQAARSLLNAHRAELGRPPLPEETPREIAQRVNTDIAAKVPATAPKGKQPDAKATTVAPKPEPSKTQAAAAAPKSEVPAAQVRKVAAKPVPQKADAPASAPRRKLPAAQQSKLKPKQVASKKIETSPGPVPVVTKVSP